MAKSTQTKLAEKAWEEKYGGMSEKELNDSVKESIGKKLEERRLRAEQRQTEYEAKYNLPYSGLVEAVAKSAKQIKALENKPEEFTSAMRAKLNEEFDDLVEAELYDKRDITSREMYISRKLVAYMCASDGEYRKAKEALRQAREDYAIYLAKKEEWEQENTDIIEAERARSRREELLSADPEALRALGITPPPEVNKAHGTTQRDL